MTTLPSPIPHPLEFCPFDVPGWAYEALEWVVGFDWPAGNEQTTWDVADRWYAITSAMTGPHSEASAAAGRVRSGYEGSGSDAFAGAWARTDEPLAALFQMADELGQLVEGCGRDLEGAKLEAWIEIGLFLTELIGMAITVAMTLGAASPAAGGLITATRIAIQQIFKRLVEQLSKKGLKAAGLRAAKQLTTREGLKHLGKDALREGIDEAREEALTNGSVQLYQNSTGRLNGINLSDLGLSTAGGFGGGFAASGAHAGKGHHPGGAIRGAGAEVLGEFGGAAMTGNLPDVQGLAKSASSGAAGSSLETGSHGVTESLQAKVTALNEALPTGPVTFAGPQSGPDIPSTVSSPLPDSLDATTVAPVNGDPLTSTTSPAHGSSLPSGPSLSPHPPSSSGDLSPGLAPAVVDSSGTSHAALHSPASLSSPTASAATATSLADTTMHLSSPADTSSHPFLPAASPAALSFTPEHTAPVHADPTLMAPGPSGPAAAPHHGPDPTAPLQHTAGPTTALASPSPLSPVDSPLAPPHPSTDSPPPASPLISPIANSPATVPHQRTDQPPLSTGSARSGTHLSTAQHQRLDTAPWSAPPSGKHRHTPRHRDGSVPVRKASEVDSYFRSAQDQRAAYAQFRQQEAVDLLEQKAQTARRQARNARRAARVAKFLKLDSGLAHHFEANVRAAETTAERAAAEARVLRDPAIATDEGSLTTVRPRDWHLTNWDSGHLAPGAVSLGNQSMLTGTGHPPPIDSTRRYGEFGGLRAPLAQHQIDLENAFPRDANGNPVRLADPRSPYFSLMNDGGPDADPTRGLNCQDCVLSFFDTYLHGRPRVSAPRTFDAYSDGDPQRPLHGEAIGPERVERTTGGRLQSLCKPDPDPVLARRNAARALSDVSTQLINGGHGSFAFLMSAWEGGSAHAWAAVNHNGEILFVDPQSGRIAPPGMSLYGHRGQPHPDNLVALDALVVDGRGNPLPFTDREDGWWRPQETTFPHPAPAQTPHSADPARTDLDRIAEALAPRPLSSEELARRNYREYLHRTRTVHEENRRNDHADYLLRLAEQHRTHVHTINDQAEAAARAGSTVLAERLRADARLARQDAENLEHQSDSVRRGARVPTRTEIDPPDWSRLNDDLGDLTDAGVATATNSALTGTGHPAPIDRSRPYGTTGGLRRPLAVHQKDLEDAMPRDPDGRVERLADPRKGPWFTLANDGGPTADPTRAINCTDGVLSLYETYIHGRPRVSAPRTFDAYEQGDPTRPLGAEKGGLSRVEATVNGEFQTLTPYVQNLHPHQAKQAIDTATSALAAHLHSAGHGAFAFIVTKAEQGTSHAWAAINQNGTILYLDPQIGRLSESIPLYTHTGHPDPANVTALDALVITNEGHPLPFPSHQASAGSDPRGLTRSQQVEAEAIAALDEAEFELFGDAIRDASLTAEVEIQRMQNLADVLSRNSTAGSDRPRVVDTESRVKSIGSLARKFQLHAATRQSDARTFLTSVNDLVRFSITLPEGNYTSVLAQALDELRARNYTVVEVASFWGDGHGRHNGLNVTLINPEGFRMEVQFPTERSRSVGKLTHTLYEITRLESSEVSTQERMEALLGILLINKLHGMPDHQPAGLDAIAGLVTVNTSLTHWATRAGAGVWGEYIGFLASKGATLDDMLTAWELTKADLPGIERLIRDDERLGLLLHGSPGGPELHRDHQPDRLPSTGDVRSPSRDVARLPQPMDLRPNDRSASPLRRFIHERIEASRPPDSSPPGARTALDRPPDPGAAPSHDPGAHPDDLSPADHVLSAAELTVDHVDPHGAEQELLNALTPADKAAIEASVREAAARAERLLPQLGGVVESLGGSARLVGIKHACKSRRSLARAFAAEFETGGVPVGEFLAGVKDRVRFAIEVPEAGYVQTVRRAVEELERAGFRVRRLVNFWGGDGRHNGLNATVEDQAGFRLEVQFPTALSWAISLRTHQAYEVVRLWNVPYAARVDGLLRMVAINKSADIASHQPAGVELLNPDKTVDSSFRAWVRQSGALWRRYLHELALHRVSFGTILERHALTSADVLLTNGTDADDGSG
ncbi:toxin glutamine deamidase domain-containing protein [Actinoplanes sp. N902-109]|uniref:toxin glutamine deamidase domain-containing protein n=1 Tax=Actinoplanes sp. (strain N902-109) TaxID=649831 RepID=UPI0003295929|nr:toxin glutamine deamidase domain-containing protein [Actinoplanes sp. N902-109]AGL21684.1 hypothetical protein L083_8174 [Actinoplanes sp. N902-109]